MANRFQLNDDFVITAGESTEDDAAEIARREREAAIRALAELEGTGQRAADEGATAMGMTPLAPMSPPPGEPGGQAVTRAGTTDPVPPVEGSTPPRRRVIELPEMAVTAPPRPMPRQSTAAAPTAPARPTNEIRTVAGKGGGADDVGALLDEVARHRRGNIGHMLANVMRSLGGQPRRERPDPLTDMRQAEALRAERGAQRRAEEDRAADARQRALREDPTSESNRRYRQALAARLPDMQIPETLTINDTETRGLFEGLATARDRENQLRLQGQQRESLTQQQIEARDRAREDEREWRDLNREDTQAFQAEEHGLDRRSREHIAELRRRVRSGGSGGNGLGARIQGTTDREAMVDLVARELNIPREEANLMVPTNARRFDTFRSQFGMAHVRPDVREGVQQSRDAAQHVIPGWDRDPGAPVLGQSSRDNLLQANAEARRVRGFSQQLAQLATEITAAQRAGAAAGVLNAKMARARAIHEQLTNALRVIGNYGVPQAAELARMERLAPRLDSVEGWLSAVPIYREMPAAIDGGLTEYMGGYGYRRARAGGGGGRQARPGMIRIRLSDGTTGSWPEGRPLPSGATEI